MAQEFRTQEIGEMDEWDFIEHLLNTYCPHGLSKQLFIYNAIKEHCKHVIANEESLRKAAEASGVDVMAYFNIDGYIEAGKWIQQKITQRENERP